MTRRISIRRTAIAVLTSATFATQAIAQVGHKFASERAVVKDPVTGVDMVVLTNGKQSDAKIYQTHPQWTSDGQWIVFRGSGRSPGSQAYAVNESTGDIVQLTEGAGNITGSLCVAKKSMKLYFLRNATAAREGLPPAGATTSPATSQPAAANIETQLIELDLARLLPDAVAGTPKPATDYEHVRATLPAGTRDANGQALDADEKDFYISITGGDVGQHLPPDTAVWQKRPGDRMGTGPGGLRKIDLATGQFSLIIDTPFKIGHVQTNPWVHGEIVYCHETGGDAPQRIWTVNADGTGNRPLFEEGPLDWVTHEAVVTKDEVMFNLIGHQKRLRVRPTGIATINLRTNAVQILGQIDERATAAVADDSRQPQNAAGPESFGGFWHCNGSPDGRWAVGDTFAGNLWLIDRQDGRRTLLSTDHKMKPDHTHPTFSDDSRRILIQSGHFTDGQRLQLIVLPVPKAK